MFFFFFFQAEDGIRDVAVTGVQTCALPIWRLGERVEIVRPAARRNGNDPRGGRAVGDRARLARRLLQILERDVVGMRVAGARSGQRPDARPLADVAGGLFHRSFLEVELFVYTVLQGDIGIVGGSD